MKNFTMIKPKTIASLVILMVLWQFSAVNAQTYNLPIAGTDAVRCGAGELTLTVSWSDEALDTDNVKWYTVPFYGTPIGTGLSLNTGYIEFTHTYYVDYIGDDGCSQCDRLLIRAVVADQVITPQVIYPSLFYCNTANQEFVPTVVGASAGTWSINQGGSGFNTSNGGFNPFGLGAGPYVVTFTPEAIEGCDSNPVSVTLTVTNAPVQPIISYAEESYCSNSSTASVTRTGASGGTYSASPSGLSINSSSGLITPASSQTGTYTVTYLVPGGGGCSPVSATTVVSIMRLPEIASFSYGTPFCGIQSQAQLPSLTVVNDFTPGATPYSYTGAGTLNLNTSTGAITPLGSNPGSYNIIYTIPASSPCGVVTANTSVVIHPVTAATIAADKTQEFKDEVSPVITFTGSVGPAPYTFTYRVDIGTGNDLVEGLPTTISTANDQTATATVEQSTEVEGVFTYVLLAVQDANGCNVSIADQSVAITILGIPDTDFIYAGSPYCTNGGTATPTGSTAGTFSYTGTGLSLNTANGEVTLATSTAETYEVTHTLNGYSSMAVIVITRLPVATFSYANASYCPTAGNVSPSITNDIGIFTANDPTVIFAEGASAGTIDAVFTPAGTYTITNTVQAANGCAEVSASTVITINAAPNYTGQRAYVICSGETTSITHTADIVGTTFSWTISEVTGGITGQSAGSGATIVQTLTNPSTTEIGTVSYMVTPSGGDCGAGVPTLIVVTVNPRPAIPTAGNLTVIYDGDEKIASATSSTMTSNSEVAVIDWYTAATGGDATTAPTGTDFGTYTAYAEARYASTGCISTARTLVTLTINKKELTVANAAITQRAYNGTTAAAITGAELSGIVSPDAVTIGDETAGTFASKNVGTGISVTTVMTISGADVANYYLTQPTLTGNIVQKALTAASTIASKVYDGTATAGTITLGAITGLVDTETVTIATSATDYADANVESGKSTTISYTLTDGTNGGLATNYSMANLTTSGNITQRPLTASSTISDKTYDGSAATGTVNLGTVSNLVSGESLTITPTAADFGNANVADGKTTTISYALANGTGGLAANYSMASIAATGDINPLLLTIENPTLTLSKVYDGNIEAVVTANAFTNKVGSDDVTINTAIANYDTKDVGTGKTITVVYTITGTGAGNYTKPVDYVVNTGVITAAPLTAATTVASKVYNGSAETGAVTLGTVTGYIGTETLAITPTASNYANANVGAAKATTISYALAAGTNGGVASNYSMADLSTSGDITAVTVTVTADNIIRGVGETTPAFTYTMSGFVNSETEQGLRDVSALSGAVSYTDNTGGSTSVGSYTITPVIDALTATNYTFSAVNGTLTITELIVEATGGTSRAGYNTLAAAYAAINNGTHTGDITINIYDNTTETSTATLNASGTGSASYTSVSLVPHNNITITGPASPLMILGN